MFARNAARALGEIARVAERGLDLPALGHVLIHHDEPAAHDLGHSGGAQCEGDAASILATALHFRTYDFARSHAGLERAHFGLLFLRHDELAEIAADDLRGRVPEQGLESRVHVPNPPVALQHRDGDGRAGDERVEIGPLARRLPLAHTEQGRRAQLLCERRVGAAVQPQHETGVDDDEEDRHPLRARLAAGEDADRHAPERRREEAPEARRIGDERGRRARDEPAQDDQDESGVAKGDLWEHGGRTEPPGEPGRGHRETHRSHGDGGVARRPAVVTQDKGAHGGGRQHSRHPCTQLGGRRDAPQEHCHGADQHDVCDHGGGLLGQHGVRQAAPHFHVDRVFAVGERHATRRPEF